MQAGDALLLVMPDGARRAAYSAAFRHAGFRVLHAPTAAIALTRCQRDLPAIVVTDVLLPQMHGVDIARALRACATAHTPLIIGVVASCFDDTEDAAESILFDHLVAESTPEIVVRGVCDAQERRHATLLWRQPPAHAPLVLH